MRRARSCVVLIATAASVALVAGACAKRPMMLTASAPAPTPAPAPPAPMSPPAPAATPPPAPVVTAPAAPEPAPQPPVVAATPPRRAAPKEFIPHDALKPIHFDFDKAEIRAADTKVLDASASWLREHPSYIMLIEGHCDERGTPAYNLALGERRAKAAMSYLTSQGIRADRLTTISFGEERAICNETTEHCWTRNRRAQFLVKEQ